MGAGIGNISAILSASRPEALFLTDPNPEYLSQLRQTFQHHDHVHIAHLELPGIAPEAWHARRIDTVVAFNVVEHILKDREAVCDLASILVPGGHLLLIVPAHQWLYSSLDVALGHHRRYTRSTATALVRQAGLCPRVVRYFNMTGALGWAWRGKVRRRSELSPLGIRIFNRLVPMLQLERLMPTPFGLSVVVVAQA